MRICENLGLTSDNQEKLAQMLYISHNLTIVSSFTRFFLNIFYLIFTHVSARNFQSENYDCANEFTFRQSALISLIASRIVGLERLRDASLGLERLRDPSLVLRGCGISPQNTLVVRSADTVSKHRLIYY